jgi:hypothetical protein
MSHHATEEQQRPSLSIIWMNGPLDVSSIKPSHLRLRQDARGLEDGGRRREAARGTGTAGTTSTHALGIGHVGNIFDHIAGSNIRREQRVRRTRHQRRDPFIWKSASTGSKGVKSTSTGAP